MTSEASSRSQAKTDGIAVLRHPTTSTYTNCNHTAVVDLRRPKPIDFLHKHKTISSSKTDTAAAAASKDKNSQHFHINNI
ncbi:unnamed protein product [Rotaria sordida]|uniref:Uncharacterized protein n=1 Tax=Rotaria sordida TaxID=392033 RepID=A0A813WVJ3_9BILA|nr:unnamed protein product [Rotaria sordida]CAF3970033.1 unnamed protein product [Rotaria sordida]CAF4159240.1 unnamed protein product [Rotaria sordida]